MPKPGDDLQIEDASDIIDAITQRQANFPDEKWEMSCMMVLLNIGERYRSVSCAEGEWVGQKKDVTNRGEGGIPLCPNGHPLFQAEEVLRLGWINSL